jgi:hypothetical protein
MLKQKAAKGAIQQKRKESNSRYPMEDSPGDQIQIRTQAYSVVDAQGPKRFQKRFVCIGLGYRAKLKNKRVPDIGRDLSGILFGQNLVRELCLSLAK